MKQILQILYIVAVAFFVSCAGKVKHSTDNLPAPGTAIDSINEPVTDVQGELNDHRSIVVIIADTGVKNGIYDVKATFGENTADGKFVMPKGLDDYKLSIKKDTAPYTYTIGFSTPEDTSFHPYLGVKCGHSVIDMHYVKSYSFEEPKN